MENIDFQSIYDVYSKEDLLGSTLLFWMEIYEI